ncbi:MAG: hypothetical protein MZV49_05140 [Rhodopseudomonas palustris]|nr:hypothetical protein [Rhodopseudomonas palustris]
MLSFVFASSWWAMGFIAAQLVLLVATPLMLIPASLILGAGSAFRDVHGKQGSAS